MAASNSFFDGKAALWGSRILTALAILMLGSSAIAKLTQQQMVIDGLTGQFGYPASLVVPIGILELACVALYAIPRTSVFGALFVTAYLGGAVATHVRVSDGFGGPVMVATVAWLGLYLRNARLRALVPLASSGE